MAKPERQVMASMKGDGRLSWDVRVTYPRLPDDFARLSRVEQRSHEVPKSFTYTPEVNGEPIFDDPLRIPNA